MNHGCLCPSATTFTFVTGVEEAVQRARAVARVFDGTGVIGLEPTNVLASPFATDVTYRVRR